ncbi:MAG: sodium:solute symporter [Planctomycetes bacterium]|nr:sodium:solute symporter [Planctomycetota bacterium]
MTLATVDWLIVIGFVAALALSAWSMREHARSVSGFLSANRLAGRYLLTVSYNMAQVGVITLVWYFQLGYDVGFTQYWWGYLEGPSLILLAITGWVIYRFRETRAMTLAQFFEMRYSKRFRVFSGVVAFVSGILNYAIFPGVTARFFIAMLGLPAEFTVAGMAIETFPAVMGALLAFAVFMVFAGGMLAVLVTDFFQGVFCFCTFVTVCYWVLLKFPWLKLEETMAMLPAGKSMVNPLGLEDEGNFNVIYWLISAFTLFYACRAWQGDQGYNSAARDAHEARMGQLLNGWRYRTLMLVTVLIPLAVRAFLTHPDWAEAAAPLQAQIAAQPTVALQAEMRVPLALGVMLPTGLLGLVVAAMLGAAISTDSAYMHSWASIAVQDIVLPFRRRPMSPRGQLLLLKGAVLAVAAFAFVFSWYWQPKEYVAMYGALTGSIFVAGGGAVIVGGLYTRWGNAIGAWSAMVSGMVVCLVGVVALNTPDAMLEQWSSGNAASLLAASSAVAMWLRAHFTGMELSFAAMMVACAAYIVGSLLGRALPQHSPTGSLAADGWFDLDRMLHRGRWRIEGGAEADAAPTTLLEKLGFDRQYKGWDRFVAVLTLAWPLAFTALFCVATPWLLWRKAQGEPVSDAQWSWYWGLWSWFILAASTVVMAWFTVGGLRDYARLRRDLRTYRPDERDDGQVH